MAVSRWSLNQLVAWVGSAALIIIFIPLGLGLIRQVTSAEERALMQRGESLARTLAGQVADHILLEDRLALHRILEKAALVDEDVRYLCVENSEAKVAASTFHEGFPNGLTEIWRQGAEKVKRFRTEDGPLMDIQVPILAGQLGSLHVGMSRAETMQATRGMIWVMGLALAGALSVVLLGAQVIASRVSSPLHQLEGEVSRFPLEVGAGDLMRVSGTREVESLARGFIKMANRLEALERERGSTQERMIHAERLAVLGELAAGLAHEIHNPLDGMQECLRYLEADPQNGDRAAKYYPMLSEGLGRIAAVMRQMLTFARSGQKVTIEASRTADMVESLALLVEKHLEGRKVRLTWRHPGGCECLCDRRGLLQAALNLVLNAAEAAEKNADAEVLIEAACDSQWVYLSVEDNGPGIPEDLRARIFDPFFTTKPPGKGTGLGLSVSRQLIRAAGGDVEVSSDDGSLGGAKFVIRIPRASSSEGERERPAS